VSRGHSIPSGTHCLLPYIDCMTKITLAILLTVFAACMVFSQTAPTDNSGNVGTICVLPNSLNPPERISPGGEYNPATLTISIDQRPPVPWPHKKTLRIEDIPQAGRHLITLRSDGKRIQSFWFRFSDYKDTTLCVSYDGYQGVQFGDKHTAYWCRCKVN
jgi:hypothetical protein